MNDDIASMSLPTLVPGPSKDVRGDDDVVWANLSEETLRMLHDHGLTVQDVLDGNMPGVDPDEIIALAVAAGRDENRHASVT